MLLVWQICFVWEIRNLYFKVQTPYYDYPVRNIQIHPRNIILLIIHNSKGTDLFGWMMFTAISGFDKQNCVQHTQIFFSFNNWILLIQVTETADLHDSFIDCFIIIF